MATANNTGRRCSLGATVGRYCVRHAPSPFDREISEKRSALLLAQADLSAVLGRRWAEVRSRRRDGRKAI